MYANLNFLTIRKRASLASWAAGNCDNIGISETWTEHSPQRAFEDGPHY